MFLEWDSILEVTKNPELLDQKVQLDQGDGSESVLDNGEEIAMFILKEDCYTGYTYQYMRRHLHVVDFAEATNDCVLSVRKQLGFYRLNTWHSNCDQRGDAHG